MVPQSVALPNDLGKSIRGVLAIVLLGPWSLAFLTSNSLQISRREWFSPKWHSWGRLDAESHPCGLRRKGAWRRGGDAVVTGGFSFPDFSPVLKNRTSQQETVVSRHWSVYQRQDHNRSGKKDTRLNSSLVTGNKKSRRSRRQSGLGRQWKAKVPRLRRPDLRWCHLAPQRYLNKILDGNASAKHKNTHLNYY